MTETTTSGSKAFPHLDMDLPFNGQQALMIMQQNWLVFECRLLGEEPSGPL
jgi:hypothetical protein